MPRSKHCGISNCKNRLNILSFLVGDDDEGVALVVHPTRPEGRGALYKGDVQLPRNPAAPRGLFPLVAPCSRVTYRGGAGYGRSVRSSG